MVGEMKIKETNKQLMKIMNSVVGQFGLLD